MFFLGAALFLTQLASLFLLRAGVGTITNASMHIHAYQHAIHQFIHIYMVSAFIQNPGFGRLP